MYKWWIFESVAAALRYITGARPSQLPPSAVVDTVVLGGLASFAGFFLINELLADRALESDLRNALKAIQNEDDDIDHQLAGAQFVVKYIETDKSKDKEKRGRAFDNNAIRVLVTLLRRHLDDELTVELEGDEDLDLQARVLVQALRALRLVAKVGPQGRDAVAKVGGLRVVVGLLLGEQFPNSVKIEAARTLKTITKYDTKAVEHFEYEDPLGIECCKRLPYLKDSQYEALFDLLNPDQDREIIRCVCSALAHSSYIRSGALELSHSSPFDVLLPLLASPVEGIRRAAAICVSNIARFDWGVEENYTVISQPSTIKSLLPLLRDIKKPKVQYAVISVLRTIFADKKHADLHADTARLLLEDKISTMHIFRLNFSDVYLLHKTSLRLAKMLLVLPEFEGDFRSMARDAQAEYMKREREEQRKQQQMQQQMQMQMLQQMGMGGMGGDGGIPPEYLQMMMAGGGGGMEEPDEME